MAEQAQHYIFHETDLAILPPPSERKVKAGVPELILFQSRSYKGRSGPELAHCVGRLQLGESASIEGEFRCGRPHGACILRGIEGVSEFLLFFQVGQPPECKRIAYANGNLYQGQTTRCLGSLFTPHGHGKLTHRTGTYEGHYHLGVRQGRGKWTCNDGQTHEGSWKNNMLDGECVVNYGNGSRYEGAMQNGLREGKGVVHLADGSKIEGTWKNNLLHGAGVARGQDGTLHEGEFVHGLRHGKGSEKANVEGEMRVIYEGEYSNGLRHGQGILWDRKSDTVYTGGFLNGRKHGKGILKGQNFEYTGQFFDGRRHGPGQLTDKDGTREVLYLAGELSEKDSEAPLERKPELSGTKRRQSEDETEFPSEPSLATGQKYPRGPEEETELDFPGA